MRRFLVFDDGYHVPNVFGENGYLGHEEDLIRIAWQPHSDEIAVCYIDLEDAWIREEVNEIGRTICLMDSNGKAATYTKEIFEEIWNSDFVIREV